MAIRDFILILFPLPNKKIKKIKNLVGQVGKFQGHMRKRAKY